MQEFHEARESVLLLLFSGHFLLITTRGSAGCALETRSQLETERDSLSHHGAAAERSAAHRTLSLSIAPHPSPLAYNAPHWGSYSYRGTARITRSSVRKIHIRGGFIPTALQVMRVFINFFISRDMYFQLFECHVGNVMY